ncbi:FERM domain-containing protein 4B [Mugil cephalus]|uniref:FERM domain-containing protein 4B n=1 Tax=Mugil cephalus TaxID=48193 RepID=UPI001FB613DF|nr:FERM domain-containing protein 4B [Mugil cephalus]XP_047442537.1 FERM domain-containing protein 4B [Mugil cephalus]XP_047442546.1 FERM domain-containing protein 4B [Mugil cephalus]
MATGVNYWSFYEPHYKVSESVWGGEPESSSEDGGGGDGGGGGVTWETQAMEVKGQLISAHDPLTCPDRKQSERMAELQERRRSLQALLTTRLAELRRICLQEAELTGAVPSDFPLEAGEKPPCVRRRGNGKSRVEEEDAQRSKPKKTLFSSALRKHSDPEHNTHSQTHTHHGKRTVHRGCHTDDTVRSESSSTSDSTGHDNDDGAAQCRPPLVTAGFPVEVLNHNKTRRNSFHSRIEHPDVFQTQKPLPPPPCHPPPLPPRSQDSSSSSGPSDSGAGGEGGTRTSARCSNSSNGLLDRIAPPEEEEVVVEAQHGGLWVNRGTNGGGAHWSSEAGARGGGRGGGRGGRGGGGYSEVLLDYVWGKQQQTSRQPITSQHQLLYNGYSAQQQPEAPPIYRGHHGDQLLYNGYSAQQQPEAPPTYRGHHGDQRRVTVTRTKSCGPFQTDNPPSTTIQPDPHPHLLPPRAPQLPPNQDSQLEEATRSLHKALALEGLRDWYLRNTLGSSHQNQTNGKVTTGAKARGNGGVKGQAAGGGALQRRRTTHGVIQQSTYQTKTSHHHKQTLPHSATFHGQPLLSRSVDSSLYHDSAPSQKQEVSLREPSVDQPSPGTLV